MNFRRLDVDAGGVDLREVAWTIYHLSGLYIQFDWWRRGLVALKHACKSSENGKIFSIQRANHMGHE